MKEIDRYITVDEAAEILNSPASSVWRMLESGAIPCVLRGDLYSIDGAALGFDYALLPVEAVRRIVDHGGDDFELEWEFAGGHGRAKCFPARKNSIRVFWLPEFFPELLPYSDVPNGGQDMSSKSAGTPPKLSTIQKKSSSGWLSAWGVSISTSEKVQGLSPHYRRHAFSIRREAGDPAQEAQLKLQASG